MSTHARLAPWQRPVWQVLQGALADDRLAHALLLSGPPLLGKRGLADLLAARLLCAAPAADGFACGRCRACQLFAAGTHPDRLAVGLLERDDGRLKTEIGVEQMRELSSWFALTPQLGRAQIAIIEPAEAMNHAAANALLKTLEEPMPARYLLLVCARPQRLPATIRSRCQRLEFRLPPRHEVRAALLALGIDAATADEALAAADGHPGLARQYVDDGSLALRREVHETLKALAEGRARPALVAPQWAADRPELRLRLAADSVREFGRRRAEAGRLTTQGDFPKLAAWFDRANRVREQLSAPLKVELLLAELLAEWRSAFARGG